MTEGRWTIDGSTGDLWWEGGRLMEAQEVLKPGYDFPASSFINVTN